MSAKEFFAMQEGFSWREEHELKKRSVSLAYLLSAICGGKKPPRYYFDVLTRNTRKIDKDAKKRAEIRKMARKRFKHLRGRDGKTRKPVDQNRDKPN